MSMILLIIFSFSKNLWAGSFVVNGSMGRDPEASRGQCLSVAKPEIAEARDLLLESHIAPSGNATDEEVIALAWGAKQVLSLNGGKPFAGLLGARVVYEEGSAVWNEENGYVEVNRAWSNETGMNSMNVGMLFHEIAHYVGNHWQDGNPATYGQYEGAVPKPCKFSWYSKRNRHEEFAEVFSTFIVHPENLLKDGSKSCLLAHDYFRKKIFPHGELATCKK